MVFDIETQLLVVIRLYLELVIGNFMLSNPNRSPQYPNMRAINAGTIRFVLHS